MKFETIRDLMDEILSIPIVNCMYSRDDIEKLMTTEVLDLELSEDGKQMMAEKIKR